ncbi:Ig-like domain-containing protein [Streptomyces lavendulae]|uniref:Ig-like domain-containing protein n=1 Tax=Streptomyces lavendulae TaxID=1914 RepID=UPI0024A31654|nr:LLM class flavin-dependent oxidoreductase [Streptomyces lavendulae]GLX16790.1 hypothetical protein Slala01_04340 [Streptomyces lavendulae subsp. lavendulae]GLX25413.1 hypothetical protein Slala02_12330 [Streptomyces lavendulae subsp. lavendulae]
MPQPYLPSRFGVFLAPCHRPDRDPALQLRRDLDLVVELDRLGYEEVWAGEHHSAGYEIIASPELFLAAAAERTSRIMLGTGVNSLPYHHAVPGRPRAWRGRATAGPAGRCGRRGSGAATVAPANPDAGTPTGEVTFFDGAVPLATVPLRDGRATARTGVLQPTTGHPVTARYGGDPAFTPATTPEPTGITVGFTEPCLTSAHTGPLTVAPGEARCIAAGGSQTGPVTVRP